MPAFTRERESKKRSQRAVQRCSTFQPIVQTSTPSNNSLPNSNPSCARSPPILSRASHSPWTACARPSSLASTKSHEQNAPHSSPIQDMGNLNGKRSRTGKVRFRARPKRVDAGALLGHNGHQSRVCIENPIHVVEVTESRRLAGWSGCCVSFWPFCVLAVQVEDLA